MYNPQAKMHTDYVYLNTKELVHMHHPKEKLKDPTHSKVNPLRNGTLKVINHAKEVKLIVGSCSLPLHTSSSQENSICTRCHGKFGIQYATLKRVRVVINKGLRELR